MDNKIKLFLTDVDGVLTDGGMYYTENGDEFKKFSVYDGMGLQILQSTGVKTGIITAETRTLNQRRAKKIGLDYYYEGIKNKLTVASELCQQLKINLNQVAYIGDDVNDLTLLRAVGIAACPLNARREVQAVEQIVKIQVAGGNGAVRAFIEYLFDQNLVDNSTQTETPWA